ncbi:hypothetical protein B4135_2240 [Caldibacillus debilis]|uniref:Uncharacterized protein n=1 Tax=Caldibacillus debilis TaxID=301148 RepID=A0A150M2Z7_9BACI|nr:hypothetical protein B4135_2240 [Caldibacillus debilis]
MPSIRRGRSAGAPGQIFRRSRKRIRPPAAELPVMEFIKPQHAGF